MARMMSAPAAPSGLARAKAHARSTQPTGRAAGAVAPAPTRELSTLISVVPDARVEPRVGEVDQEIDHHEAERDQEDEGLHHRVVAVRDRVDHEPAHSVEGEDGLGD